MVGILLLPLLFALLPLTLLLVLLWLYPIYAAGYAGVYTPGVGGILEAQFEAPDPDPEEEKSGELGGAFAFALTLPSPLLSLLPPTTEAYPSSTLCMLWTLPLR